MTTPATNSILPLPTAASIVGKLLTDLYQNLSTIAAVKGIFPGKTRLQNSTGADGNDLDKIVQALPEETQGVVSLWVDGRHCGNATEPVGSVTIRGEVRIHLNCNTTSSTIQMWDFLESVATVLLNRTLYAVSGLQPAPGFEWTNPDDNAWADDVIVFDFSLTFPTGALSAPEV